MHVNIVFLYQELSISIFIIETLYFGLSFIAISASDPILHHAFTYAFQCTSDITIQNEIIISVIGRAK